MDRADILALRKPRTVQAQVTVADMMIGYLEQLGVEYVFGVPGGAIEPFYDALARSARHGGPRVVTVRHEASAAFMADGYARETGRLGVCISTSGPGATNMITGVASAAGALRSPPMVAWIICSLGRGAGSGTASGRLAVVTGACGAAAAGGACVAGSAVVAAAAASGSLVLASGGAVTVRTLLALPPGATSTTCGGGTAGGRLTAGREAAGAPGLASGIRGAF